MDFVDRFYPQMRRKTPVYTPEYTSIHMEAPMSHTHIHPVRTSGGQDKT